MIKFYTNRELSQKFGINLAKWKRWSREFLPPDPLGGLQSGYARQYNLGNAFTVFLGGHLIAGIKFTVPEAKKILDDLYEWLTRNGFYFDIQGLSTAGSEIRNTVMAYQIFIHPVQALTVKDLYFNYTIRGILSNEPSEHMNGMVREERFIECTIPENQKALTPYSNIHTRLLNISHLRNQFLIALNLSENNFHSQVKV